MPQNKKEITFGLCHIQDILKYKVNIPKVQGVHLMFSIFGENYIYDQRGEYDKQTFQNAFRNKLSSILNIPLSTIRLLSINGGKPLRVDVEIQTSQNTENFVNLFGKQTSPLLLFQINEIKNKTKVYITGIRGMN